MQRFQWEIHIPLNKYIKTKKSQDMPLLEFLRNLIVNKYFKHRTYLSIKIKLWSYVSFTVINFEIGI